jgi:FkbM family methyltransferase
MFSLTYLLKSLLLLITHPSSIVGLLRGYDPSTIIDKKRRAKWDTIKAKFASDPKKATGFSIFLNPNDDSAVSSSIGTVGWLNLALTELFRKILKEGMTFVDAGANIGYYTLLAASSVGESGRVYAFEPEPESFALMVKSIEYNRFQNITAERAALSEEEGVANLSFPMGQDRHATVAVQTLGKSVEGRTPQRIGVGTTTLDYLGDSRKIDVIKIHTSGSEPQVLRGARNLIKKHHPRIIVSYVPKLWRDDEDLLDFLRVHYEIFEVLQSPKLTRRMKPTNSSEWKAAELYLVPRNLDP